jgi:Flp pilus assembly protein TadB
MAAERTSDDRQRSHKRAYHDTTAAGNGWPLAINILEVPMAFLFLFFTVALSLCVVGLIVIGLAAMLGSLRDYWELKKPRIPRPGEY